MTESEQLIETLAADLRPVQPLRPPALRALQWLAIVAFVSLALILRFADLAEFARRMAVGRTLVDWIATVATAIAAVLAAFELSVPGRSPRWAWLPLPSFLVWLAASGLGCLANGLSLYGPDGFVGESSHCVVFIFALSVPLSAGLLWMLRQANPIAPRPVAALGALGAAATAAAVLQFFHPFDVTVIDLALHLAAVGSVMLVVSALKRPLLAPA